MLAQNFKTAIDLGITSAEHDVLIKVLGMLERGELVHDRRGTGRLPNGFNMDHWGSQTECGSVGCIYGWCRFVGKSDMLFEKEPPAVKRLFRVDHLHDEVKQWSDITPDQAASALRNYLTLGEARWGEVLGITLAESP